jgi:hypothetical protein
MLRAQTAACGLAVLALAMLFGCAPVQHPGATSTGQPAQPPPASSGSGSARGTGMPASSKHAHATSGGAGNGAAPAARMGVPVAHTTSGGAIRSSGAAPAVVDSGPSADALAVLATIPEPLPPSERSTAAKSSGTAGGKATATKSTTGGSARSTGAKSATGGSAGAATGGKAAAGAGAAAGAKAAADAAAGKAAGDSANATSGASAGAASDAEAGATGAAERIGAATSAAVALVLPDSARADSAAADSMVPVPEPTEPLGERHEAFAKMLADTVETAPPPPPPAEPRPAQSEPDSCWRIQVSAPTEKKEAELKREAAESVLLVKFEIVHEKQRYKVRNKECLTREACDRLRRRAIQSGFEGTFPVMEVRK